MKTLIKKTVVALSSLGFFISPFALAQDTNSTENNSNQPAEVAFPSQQQTNTNSSNALVTMPWASVLNMTSSLTQDPFYSSSSMTSIQPAQLNANMGSPFIMAFNQEATANAATKTLSSTFTNTQTTMAVSAVFNPAQHPADVAASLFSLGAPPPNLSFVALAEAAPHPITGANFAGLPTHPDFVTGFSFSNVAPDASAMEYLNQHASSLGVHGAPLPGGSLAHTNPMLSFSADAIAISQLTSEDYQHQATHTFAYNLPKAGIFRILPYLPANAHRMINSPNMSIQEASNLLSKHPNLAFNLRSPKNNRSFFLWQDPNSHQIHQIWANTPNNMMTVNGITFHKRYATMNASRLAYFYEQTAEAVPDIEKPLKATLAKGAQMFAVSSLPNKMLILRDQKSADFAARMIEGAPAIKGNLSLFVSHDASFDGSALFKILADKLSPLATSQLMIPSDKNMGALQGMYKQFFQRGQISRYTLRQPMFKMNQISPVDQRLLMGNNYNKTSAYPLLPYKQVTPSNTPPSLPTLEKHQLPGY